MEMKRFRICAGPNGSGKSTIIKQIRQAQVNGHPIDFGIYVNADDIAVALGTDTFTFDDFDLTNITADQVLQYAQESGLLRNEFTEEMLNAAAHINNNRVTIKDERYKEFIAQLLSNFLVHHLLHLGKKCSMETVFSHVSKVQFMQQANALGYKVYLYFIATVDADINIARVKSRVAKGGHDVPEHKIRDRYAKSLDLLYDAAQEAYQAFFFDNSGEPNNHNQFAHFKIVSGKKKWDSYTAADLPDWFVQYYFNKQNTPI